MKPTKTVITRKKSGEERRRDITKSIEEIVTAQLERLKVQATQHLFDHNETNLLKTILATLPAIDAQLEIEEPVVQNISKEKLRSLAKAN